MVLLSTMRVPFLVWSIVLSGGHEVSLERAED